MTVPTIINPSKNSNTAAAAQQTAKESQSDQFPPSLIMNVSKLLEVWCSRDDQIAIHCPNNQMSKFHSIVKPDISIKDYLDRIRKYAGCSDACFILAAMYIERVRAAGLSVDSLSIHRLLITSTTVAAKYFDDHYYRNSLYANVGGLTTLELNQLEWEFFTLLNLNLAYNPSDYFAFDALIRSFAVSDSALKVYRHQILSSIPQSPKASSPSLSTTSSVTLTPPLAPPPVESKHHSIHNSWHSQARHDIESKQSGGSSPILDMDCDTQTLDREVRATRFPANNGKPQPFCRDSLAQSDIAPALQRYLSVASTTATPSSCSSSTPGSNSALDLTQHYPTVLPHLHIHCGDSY